MSRNRRTLCTALVTLISTLAVGLSTLGALPATAAPALDGWHHGWCKEGEGLAVVVDFGLESERGWEVRCQVGGNPDRPSSDFVDLLEAVGYPVTVGGGGLTKLIDGVGPSDPEDYRWWMYSGNEGIADGWGGQYTLPSGQNLTNWFYGICLSESGCQPRVAPQYAATATLALSGSTSTPYGTAASITVKVTLSDGSPTGSVTMAGVGASRTRTLANGETTFALSRSLAVRTHLLTFTFNGAGTSATAKRSLTVAKGSTGKPVLSVTKAPTASRIGSVLVRVPTSSGLIVAPGSVAVVLKKGKRSLTVTRSLSAGRASIQLPKLTKGTWRASVTYRGSTVYKPATSTTYSIVVR